MTCRWVGVDGHEHSILTSGGRPLHRRCADRRGAATRRRGVVRADEQVVAAQERLKTLVAENEARVAAPEGDIGQAKRGRAEMLAGLAAIVNDDDEAAVLVEVPVAEVRAAKRAVPVERARQVAAKASRRPSSAAAGSRRRRPRRCRRVAGGHDCVVPRRLGRAVDPGPRRVDRRLVRPAVADGSDSERPDVWVNAGRTAPWPIEERRRRRAAHARSGSALRWSGSGPRRATITALPAGPRRSQAVAPRRSQPTSAPSSRSRRAPTGAGIGRARHRNVPWRPRWTWTTRSPSCSRKRCLP